MISDLMGYGAGSNCRSDTQPDFGCATTDAPAGADAWYFQINL